MKIYYSALCAIIFGIFLVTAIPYQKRTKKLLGAKECTWGPSFWCSNITNAKSCNAVPHCIQTVWETKVVPEDNDSICQICLDMVKQARDQLESNETQSDLKAVFEGSCKLIPLKPIQQECCKLADNFIPELIEALASQMNPQVVCSVAGLCNNAAIDKMLAEMPVTTRRQHNEIELDVDTTTVKKEKPTESSVIPTQIVKVEHTALTCDQCNSIGSIISNKFHTGSRDDVLENLLSFCGSMSSYSDACSNIVISYFNEIYERVKDTLTADSLCHLSGVCSSKYHHHPEIVEIRPNSDVGVVDKKEDIPCELCEQLIRHLRDVLVANTTESEFKQVLEGLCKQTKGFTKQCLSIVDEYYDIIYKSLVDNLDENGACFLIGVCPKNLLNYYSYHNDLLMPLLPVVPSSELKVVIKGKTELQQKKKIVLGENEPTFTNEQINAMQLPIDQLMRAPHADTLIKGGEYCTLCEYFLHFVQEALATPANEDKVKEIVGKTCEKFSSTIRSECHQFVETYGDMIIALLIQEIDPRQVCPEIKLCPPKYVKDMEVFSPKPINVLIKGSEKFDKPTCPLCLFAVTQAKEMLKDDKTTDHVKKVLDELCTYAPKKLQEECIDFVDTYSKELIQMLITDFTAQQICVYIKLCPESRPNLSELNMSFEDGESEILTNEIRDNTVNGKPIENFGYEVGSPECMLCKEIIKEAEKRIVNKKSKSDIKRALEEACEKVHQIRNKCHSYVDKYGDKIIDLIMEELSPKEICTQVQLCSSENMDDEDLDIDEALKIDIIAIPLMTSDGKFEKKSQNIYETEVTDTPQCTLCQLIMSKLEIELREKKTQEEIKQSMRKICTMLPKKIANSCDSFVDQYADAIIDLLDTAPPKEICGQLMICDARDHINDKVDDLPQCVLCQFIMSKLEIELSGKKTQEEIKNSVEKICAILPKTVSASCNSFIEKYANTIINLLDTVPPKEICSHLMICGIMDRINNEVIECGVCHGAVISLSPMIKKDSNINMKNVTTEVCESLPGQYKTQCAELVQVYGISIRNLINSNAELSTICATIGKCYAEEQSINSYIRLGGSDFKRERRSNTDENVDHGATLVGANPCTWGPSHWCQNSANARACSMHDWCVTNNADYAKAQSA